MDGKTLLVIIVAIFGILILAWMVRYRRRGEAQIEVGGVKMGVKGENDPTPDKTAVPAQITAPATSTAPDRPGVNITDAEAGDDVIAEDKTGQGTNVQRVKTQGGILASSETPPAPKA